MMTAGRSTVTKRFLAVLVCLFLAMGSVPAHAQFNAFKDPVVGGGSTAASGPDLKATTAQIAAGKVTIGATAYVVAVFKNTGTSAVNVTGINLYPSSTVTGKVSLNKCAEAPLPPEAECAITVAVTGLISGSWRVEILLDHDGRTRLATAAMTGEVAGSEDAKKEEIKQEVEATPAELDFGDTDGSASLVRSILFRNRTSEAVSLKEITLDAPEQAGLSYKSQCPDTLNSGEVCNVLVTWSPLAKGTAQGVLRLSHSAKSGVSQVEIKGSYSPESFENAPVYPGTVPDRGILIADKERIDFGSDIRSASAITVSLVNTGSVPLTINNIMLSGSENGLSILRSGCRPGTILSPIEACPLTLNWVPSRAGPVIDDVQVHHNGARGILLLPVRGTAAAAVSQESLAVRQTSSGMVSDGSADGTTGSPALPPTPVMDGYIVTSHSPSRAIINGPIGSIVVRDGEDVVISRVKWTVTIVPTGVLLTSAEDEILLLFDKSLRPATAAEITTTSSTSSDTTTSTP